MTDKTTTALTAETTVAATDLMYAVIGSNSRKVPLSGTFNFGAIALGGATIGTDKLAVTGTASISGGTTISGQLALNAGLFVQVGDAIFNASGLFYWQSRAVVSSPADGVLRLTSNAQTGFTGLMLGPSGTTYNRLKHNAAGVLELRLADDSAQATWDALAYRVAGTKVVGAQGAAVADATDAASAITQLNALLARTRAHGLIAT